jgi:hypothetical protein
MMLCMNQGLKHEAREFATAGPAPSVTCAPRPAARIGRTWRLAQACVLALAALAGGATHAQPDEDEDGQAQPPASAPAAAPVRMEVSEDGTLVIDARSKVAWSRCLEGTRWNGKTCAGLPRLFTRGEAQAVARERSQAEGVAWRLPRATELRHLVQRRAVPPGVDSALFPSSPGTWHWSSTSRIHTGSVNMYNYGNAMQGSTGGVANRIATRQGWAVDMASGDSSPVHKDSTLPVRLVRPYP